MLLLDLTHTSHTPARTGIQRVARALHQNFGDNALAVTRDPFLGGWRALEAWELADLARSQGGLKRKATWPASAKWRGRFRRAFGRAPQHLLRGEFDALIVPELFSVQVARDLPKLFAHVRGPRVALFHDPIPLRFPELTPPGTVARLPVYLQDLLQFDGIAAISEESRASLLAYWKWLGVTSTPTVAAIPLGVDPPRTAGAEAAAARESASPVVLCVGTLEGRKNHGVLLDACEALWARDVRFELRLIGHVNAETGGPALARVRALQAAGRPVRFDGPATDEAIAAAYAEAAFTVYPSIAEGFGLPVIESLARGKPCICSAKGALGEISQHGGCVALATLTAESIAGAIADLLARPDELARLSAVARGRRFKSWADYARDLESWIQTVRRR